MRRAKKRRGVNSNFSRRAWFLSHEAYKPCTLKGQLSEITFDKQAVLLPVNKKLQPVSALNLKGNKIICIAYVMHIHFVIVHSPSVIRSFSNHCGRYRNSGRIIVFVPTHQRIYKRKEHDTERQYENAAKQYIKYRHIIALSK